MYTLLVIVHVVVSLAIIAIVLLQAGKGADIGSAFGGAGSQTVFGSMTTPTLLGKITTVVALMFMLTSFSLAMLASRRAASVMTQPAPVQQPATPPGGQK
ncbi:MAG: preprotein translocase subunit SecG [Candidatus Rokubacteria bacterium]|nr:preprotein translocase subunit SecG [Candidatus Rokubacteria bacterium]MBI2554524.1 preprotein translocase subunit SecG [Candidatus Rokubacteria bacterium]